MARRKPHIAHNKHPLLQWYLFSPAQKYSPIQIIRRRWCFFVCLFDCLIDLVFWKHLAQTSHHIFLEALCTPFMAGWETPLLCFQSTRGIFVLWYSHTVLEFCPQVDCEFIEGKNLAFHPCRPRTKHIARHLDLGLIHVGWVDESVVALFAPSLSS